MMWGSNWPPDLLPKMGAALCGFIFALVVLQILLFPLRTNTKKESFLWEAVVAGLCLLLLGSGLMNVAGAVALLGFVIGLLGLSNGLGTGLVLIPAIVILYLMLKRAPAEAAPGRFQFSVRELLAMILSGAALPLLVEFFGIDSAQRTYTMLLLVLPLLYWRAYARFYNNCVPLCTERVLFLACYPWMVLGMFYCSILFFAYFAGVEFESLPRTAAKFVFLLMIFAGTILAQILGKKGEFERTTHTLSQNGTEAG
jgi:hypothetical protein